MNPEYLPDTQLVSLAESESTPRIEEVPLAYDAGDEMAFHLQIPGSPEKQLVQTESHRRREKTDQKQESPVAARPRKRSVNSSSIEHFINHIQETVSMEEIFLLLTEDDAWDKFVARTNFSREVAKQVREGLMVQEILKDTSDEDRDEPVQEYSEMLLKEFTRIDKEIKQRIAQLRALADKADKVHKKYTILNLAVSSTGIVSGILSMAGIGLAPVTAGMSLGLTVTGIGLGAASAVTDAIVSRKEHTKMKAIEADAIQLTSTLGKPEKTFLTKVFDSVPKLNPIMKIFTAFCDIKPNIRALKLIRANPQLATRAAQLMNSGKMSARSARLMQKAFNGTALAVSKAARVAGMVSVGAFLLIDASNVVRHSLHLQEGAESESALWLREQAAELERKLEKLKGIYESLLEDGHQEPRAECGAEA